jgi:transposase
MPAETLETYLQPVWSGTQALTSLQRENAAGQLEKIAEGYEQPLILNTDVDGQPITWTERHLIVRSFQHARASETALRTRLTKAQAELRELNQRQHGKKLIEDAASMQAAADKVLQHYRVADLLKLTLVEQRTERHTRAHGT